MSDAAEPLRVLERHADRHCELPARPGLHVRGAEEGAAGGVGVLRVGAVALGRGEDLARGVLPAGELALDRADRVGREGRGRRSRRPCRSCRCCRCGRSARAGRGGGSRGW